MIRIRSSLSRIQYNIVTSPTGEASVTCFLDGEPFTAVGTHPNYERIIDALTAYGTTVAPGFAPDEEAEAVTEYVEELKNLFDVGRSIHVKFEALSERVAVSRGRILFDGQEVDSSLANHVLRVYDAGGDFSPVVNFFEKVATNPSSHSREQLFDWLRSRDFAITADGDVLAYKGVAKRHVEDGFPYQSVHEGVETVRVNGEEFTGYIPNAVGAVVEMAREEVAWNPTEACSVGLHVGTHGYASSWAHNGGALLTVAVNPRDVVSVPTDAAGAKVRVCRYRVLDVTEIEHTEPVYARESWDWDADTCEDCGDVVNEVGDTQCEDCRDLAEDVTCGACGDCDECAEAAEKLEQEELEVVNEVLNAARDLVHEIIAEEQQEPDQRGLRRLRKFWS